MKRLWMVWVVTILVRAATLDAQTPTEIVEWRYVGSDQAHTKYSVLDDINLTNVDELEIAWTWEPDELRRVKGPRTKNSPAFVG